MATDSAGTVRGRAVVFSTETTVGGQFNEVIAPSALDGLTLEDVCLLRDHETPRVVARTTAGSLKLNVTPYGLDFVASLAATTDGRDAFTLVSGGEVSGCSFAFYASKDSWIKGRTRNDLPTRIVEEIAWLPEITLTAAPAYRSTYVTAGSAPPQRSASPDYEMAWAAARADRVRVNAADPELAHRFNRPGTVPIPRPSFAKPPIPREVFTRAGVAALERRCADYGEYPLEVAAMLLEPDVSAGELLAMYAADKPSRPGRAGYSLSAYRLLAQSRALDLETVLTAVRAGHLGDIVALPVVTAD